LPNDLLHVFEEGQYEIPELARLGDAQPIEVHTHDGSKVKITNGKVICCQFPFVILTSNHEKEFPPPFLRRCLRLEIPQPTPDKLAEIVQSQMGHELTGDQVELVELFWHKRDNDHRELATDQLLNVVHILSKRYPKRTTELVRCPA
jgi:MoxR-like ATPase